MKNVWIGLGAITIVTVPVAVVLAVELPSKSSVKPKGAIGVTSKEALIGNSIIDQSVVTDTADILETVMTQPKILTAKLEDAIILPHLIGDSIIDQSVVEDNAIIDESVVTDTAIILQSLQTKPSVIKGKVPLNTLVGEYTGTKPGAGLVSDLGAGGGTTTLAPTGSGTSFNPFG